MVVVCQCRSKAANLSGSNAASQDEDSCSRWSYSSGWHGNRWIDTEDNTTRIRRLHSADNSSPHQHDHGQRPVIRCAIFAARRSPSAACLSVLLSHSICAWTMSKWLSSLCPKTDFYQLTVIFILWCEVFLESRNYVNPKVRKAKIIFHNFLVAS